MSALTDRAFSRRKGLETVIGFVLHSALLVPYFTCAQKPRVASRVTNHLTEGETHVPPTILSANGRAGVRLQLLMGRALGPLIITSNLLVGWFVYAAIGGLSASDRGYTSHLWPFWPLATRLSPGRWKAISSTAGLACTIGVLVWWASRGGWAAPALLYGGPDPRRQRMGRRLHVAASHRCRRAASGCERLDVDSGSVSDRRSSLRSSARLICTATLAARTSCTTYFHIFLTITRAGDSVDRDRVSTPLPI